MKTASARQANHEFSELLSRVERGEEITITKRNKPMALLSPYRPPLLSPERRVAIDHATDVMAKGLDRGGAVRIAIIKRKSYGCASSLQAAKAAFQEELMAAAGGGKAHHIIGLGLI